MSRGTPPDKLDGQTGRPVKTADVAADRFALLDEPPPTNESAFRALRWVLPLIGMVLVGLLLYVGKPILLPLVIATLLAFLLAPLCEWMERRSVPRVVATVIVVGLAGSVLVGLGLAVYGAVMQIDGNFDAYRDELVKKASAWSANDGPEQDPGIFEKIGQGTDDLGKALAGDTVKTIDEPEADPTTAEAPVTQPAEPTDAEQGVLAQLAGALQEFNEVMQEEEAVPTTQPAVVLGDAPENPLYVEEIPQEQTSLERAVQGVLFIAGPVGTAALAAVFLLFILLQRDDLRDRLIKLTAGSRINLATQALDDAAGRISRYLRAQCIINGTYGVAVGVGLLTISYALAGSWFPGVILWSVLCFALRFIPYIGPWMGASFPLLISLAGFEGLGMFLAVMSFFVVLELISNNVMEPMLYGRSVGMSEFAIIIAASVWTFLWGPEGLLVATPLTTCLVVLGKHVPQLKFFDILLGDEPVLAPHTRLYQRLLAMDADDAADVAEEYRQGHTLTETFDNVLLPTLALAERDREAGNLSAERSDFIRKTMRDLVDQLGDQESPLPSDSVDINEPIPLGPTQALLREARVVLLPASDDADETAARMLKVLLDRRGFTVTVVDPESLASEKLEQVFSQRADVVLISALPPRAVGRARYLVKRLGACGIDSAEDLAVLVGLWTVTGDADKLRRRICGSGKSVGQVRVLADLEDAAEAVRQRAEVITARRAAAEAVAEAGKAS